MIAVAKNLWAGRKTIFISLGVCFVLGLFIALLSPKVYTVTTVLVPQMSSGSKSSLSSLASLAGVDLGVSQSRDLSPILYPKIVGSIPFKLELMNMPVHFEEVDTPMTVYNYFIDFKKSSVLGSVKKYTIGLPGVLLGAIRKQPEALVLPEEMNDKPIQLTKEQDKIKKMLDDNVSLGVDKKEGYLTLTVNMPEALAAAEVAQKAQELLQDFITQFKVEKSKAELDFIQERYNEAKAEAEGYQYSVASNADRYKDLTSYVPQVSSSRLQTKYNIANSVYLELAKQLEQAKIQVQKDTPVFTIVEPVTIPTEKSGPSGLKTLVVWLFLGGIIVCGIIYGKQWVCTMRKKWQSA
jgi:hypothetical protein